MLEQQKDVFSWPIRVYLEDTDATGVVYHANYLRYFERARSEWLVARGLSHARLLREHGAVFTLTEVNARYVKPARLGDVLEATVQVQATSRASLTFAQTLRRTNPAETLTKASATIVCVCADTFRPRAWPTGWLPTV